MKWKADKFPPERKLAMNDFVSLWDGGPVFRQSEHFKLGTDSVLLADFVNIGSRRRGIDLGCGSGILPLLLLSRDARLCMTGLELNCEAAEAAEANLAANALSERGSIVVGDIRSARELFCSGEFDLVVANPPYFAEGSGRQSPDDARASARTETTCTLDDICRAASYLCRTGGVFCLVHRAERLCDVLCTLREHGLEPKRLRTVSHDTRKAPSLVLIEARRGGSAGLQLMLPLFVRNADGTETAEILKIYHREGTP